MTGRARGSGSGVVVVPLDGSRLAEQALPWARAVARRSGALLHLVTVHEPGPPLTGNSFDASYDPAWYATTHAGQKEYLEGVAARVAESGLAVERTVLDGPVVPALLDFISRRRPRLVLMASHGRGGVNRLWLGSTLDRLLRAVSTPLLVVRAAEEAPGSEPATEAERDAEPAPERILVPLDGSPLSLQVLPPALYLGGLFGCRYELLQVVRVPYLIGSPHVAHSVHTDRAALERDVADAASWLDEVAAGLRKDRGAVVETRVVEAPTGPVAEAILAAASDRADLLALATHGRGGLRRLVLGSVADKLIRAASLPVLVVHPQAERD